MAISYSNTPLAKKLGIKPNHNLYIYNSLANYKELLGSIVNEVKILDEPELDLDFVHVFCTSIDEFERVTLDLKQYLKKSGMMWVSWPKGSSSIETDLKRDVIRNFILKHGLVDTKVTAINANWSGLKFVYRLKDR